MAAERHSRKMFLRSACRSLVWAGERDRTDAVEGSLRQVYAELGGMIGASHRSERHMLFEGDGPKGGFRYPIARSTEAEACRASLVRETAIVSPGLPTWSAQVANGRLGRN
jgi:hypothetical protein